MSIIIKKDGITEETHGQLTPGVLEKMGISYEGGIEVGDMTYKDFEEGIVVYVNGVPLSDDDITPEFLKELGSDYYVDVPSGTKYDFMQEAFDVCKTVGSVPRSKFYNHGKTEKPNTNHKKTRSRVKRNIHRKHALNKPLRQAGDVNIDADLPTNEENRQKDDYQLEVVSDFFKYGFASKK